MFFFFEEAKMKYIITGGKNTSSHLSTRRAKEHYKKLHEYREQKQKRGD